MSNCGNEIQLHLCPQAVQGNVIHCSDICLNHIQRQEGDQSRRIPPSPPSTSLNRCNSADVNDVSFCYALVVGLPVEASFESVLEMFDPVKDQCHRIALLTETKRMTFSTISSSSSSSLSEEDSSSWQQSKVFALVTFTSSTHRKLFTTLYHNLPMTAFSECAPSICVDVSSVHVDYRPPHPAVNTLPLEDMKSSTLSPLILPLLPHVSTAIMYLSSIATLSSFIPLPTCSLCMRRLRFVTADLLHTSTATPSHQSTPMDGKQSSMNDMEDIVTGDIAVGRTFHCTANVHIHPHWLTATRVNSCAGKADNNVNDENKTMKDIRCFVCAMYDLIQKKEYYKSNRTMLESITKGLSSQIGKCVGCGLSENIWICMHCGYAGCGRYTSKHAHSHYLATTTNTAETDGMETSFAFPHPYSLELATGRIWDYSLDRFLNYEQVSSLYSGMLPTDNFAIHHNLTFERYDTTTTQLALDTEEVLSTSQSEMGVSATKMLVSYEELVSPLTTTSIPTDMQHNVSTDKMEQAYEQMLELEVQEQSLQYEKLLARETVKAMEWAYRMNHNQPRNNHQQHQGDTKKKSSSSSSSGGSGQNQKLGTEASIEEGLQDIEDMKLVISAMEAEYRSLQQQVSLGEEEIRNQKLFNDAIIREHKALKEEEAKMEAEIAEVRRKANEQIEDLEQQVRDLTFYVNTKHKLDSSPYREELSGSTLITTVDDSAAAKANNGKKKLNPKGNKKR